jgi:hypothetical protein
MISLAFPRFDASAIAPAIPAEKAKIFGDTT